MSVITSSSSASVAARSDVVLSTRPATQERLSTTIEPEHLMPVDNCAVPRVFEPPKGEIGGLYGGSSVRTQLSILLAQTGQLCRGTSTRERSPIILHQLLRLSTGTQADTSPTTHPGPFPLVNVGKGVHKKRGNVSPQQGTSGEFLVGMGATG